MSLGAILGSIGLDIGSSALDFASNRYAQRSQNAFTREMMTNRYQWQMQDMEKAGLNPMLSAGAAPPMGGSAGMQPIKAPDFMGNALQRSASASQLKAVKAESESKQSGAEVETQKNEYVLQLMKDHPWLVPLMAAPGGLLTGAGIASAAAIKGLFGGYRNKAAAGAVTKGGAYATEKLFRPESAKYAKGPARFQLFSEPAKSKAGAIGRSALKMLPYLFNPYVATIFGSAAASAHQAKKWKLNDKKIKGPRGGLYNTKGGY